jgi:hypothetical protein
VESGGKVLIDGVKPTPMMIQKLTQATLLAALLNPAHAEVILGGDETTDVNNWTTSSVAFDDTVQSGHSFNWENVITNTSNVDSIDGEFDLTWEAGADHTVGHLFMYDQAIDLATLADGIEKLYWVVEFETTAFANWSPVISITEGGATRYYRWNHSNNDWSGNGPLNFSAPFNGADPYRFDLSQLGNGKNTATGIWGELNGSASNFAETRNNPTGPNLQAATGEIRFGFLQWTTSNTEALALQSFTTDIECFEVIVNSDPGVAPVVTLSDDHTLTAISAEVSGDLSTFGTDFSNVTVYWGESDGGSDPGAWDASAPLGFRFCDFTTEITGLTRNTSYFFRFFAENGAGSDWSDTAGSFTTALASSPTVTVTQGNSDSPVSASFIGEVTDTGNENPTITMFYGTIDQGTAAGSWDANFDLGAQGGGFSASVDGLQSDTRYFYRAFAENSAGGAWSTTTQSVSTNAFEGVSNSLASEDFDLRYEMDVNPGTQDLDGLGGSDWFANAAQATGVDQTMIIPQSYADGIASSSQAGAVPEALFRTDYGGSVSRESLVGNFTVEVAVKLKAGTIAAPGSDLGGFGIFLNPPGQSALRLNISENEMSTGAGDFVIVTGSNTDVSHLYRVAYVAADRRFTVWRDGFLIFGGETALVGSEDSLFTAGGFFLGDFAADLSGDWEVDYIRLHNEAVAPTGVIEHLAVTESGFVNPTTFFIDFKGRPSVTYKVTSSTTPNDFRTEESLNFGADASTDTNGIGRAEINVTGRVSGKLFFRLEREQ